MTVDEARNRVRILPVKKVSRKKRKPATTLAQKLRLLAKRRKRGMDLRGGEGRVIEGVSARQKTALGLAPFLLIPSVGSLGGTGWQKAKRRAPPGGGPMMTIEDFTELEEGTLVASDGPVCRCPHCGRNGILRSGGDGRVRFVHAEASRMFGDGMSVDAEDYCTMPEMTVAHELA